MCGIVGYIGERDSVPIILDSLQRLEYRGYDSAGIAVIDAAGALTGTKAEGKLQRLAERLRNGGRISGRVGVGHTRWATHGLLGQDCGGAQRHHRKLRAAARAAHRARPRL
jgi:glutamine---fructose-6-phosphate transaminase (isomerizing)